LPGDTESQLRELSDLIHRLVLERCHENPAILSAEQQQAASPPLELPAQLAANARGLGIELSRDQWVMLDEDERYVLMKLGGGNHVKRNFEPALKEFLKVEKDGSPSSSQNIHQD
jgi:hypothetical protein